MNRIYGVFWWRDEPQLLREFRSLKNAVMYKLEMIDLNADYNFRIMVREMSEWHFLEDEDEI